MLNDTQIRAARPNGRLYRLYDQRGLYLEINPSGAKYWSLKYRFAKEKRLAIGVCVPNL